jgi:ketosteroid isomerase-like protein
MSQSTTELAGRYMAAWAARDVALIVAQHTPDSVFHVHGLTDPAEGRAAITEVISAMFERAPDLAFAGRRSYLGPDHIVFEYLMSGTVDAVHFACDGVDVISVRDGLVHRKDTYLDLASYPGEGLAHPGGR